MTVVVVGNPKPMSRTRAAAELIATKLTGEAPTAVIDVIDLGAGLLGWGDPKVADAKATVLSADSLVVASPTFKGTYTGLLKLFLDQFGAGELDQKLTFAVMLGGSAAHSLAPEVTLRPVLVEIGASCPAPSLYLIDKDYETSARLDEWLAIARRYTKAMAELPRCGTFRTSGLVIAAKPRLDHPFGVMPAALFTPTLKGGRVTDCHPIWGDC